MPEISIEKGKQGRHSFSFKLLESENLKDCARAQGSVLAASSFIRTAQDEGVTAYRRGLALDKAKAILTEKLPADIAEQLVTAITNGQHGKVILEGTDKKGYTIIEPVDAT